MYNESKMSYTICEKSATHKSDEDFYFLKAEWIVGASHAVCRAVEDYAQQIELRYKKRRAHWCRGESIICRGELQRLSLLSV